MIEICCDRDVGRESQELVRFGEECAKFVDQWGR